MTTGNRQHQRSRQDSSPSSLGQLGVIDLFSGAGGLSLGAARAGFRVLAAVDNDSRAGAIYKANFPAFCHLDRDIAHLAGAQLRSGAGIRGRAIVHGVIGGPPCQGFSCIGHRDPDDERNSLFWHFFRLVSEVRPLFYLAENVVGILDHRYEVLRQGAMALVRDYHQLPPILVRSCDYGAATSRERVLFIGYRSPFPGYLGVDAFAPPNASRLTTVQIALRGLPPKIDPEWQQAAQGWQRLTERPRGGFWRKVFSDIPPGVGNPEAIRRLRTMDLVSSCLGTRHTVAVGRRFSALGEGEVDRPSRAVRLSRQGLCPTIRSGTGPERGSYQALRPVHPTEPRVITPREAARLQGFPDWFVFDDTKWHSFRQIGNSVSPLLAEGVLRAVVASMQGEGGGRETEDPWPRRRQPS